MTLGDIADIAAVAGSIVASLTLVFIALQMKDRRRFTQAELINTLEAEFRSLYHVYEKLLPDCEWSSTKSGPASSQNLCDIEAYVQFFERMEFVLELGALDLRNLDRLYGQRFFLVMHNLHVQEKLLYRDEDYFLALIQLYRRWYAYREAHGLPFPNPDTLPSHRFAPQTAKH